jgi:hypothetical protein
MEHRFNFVCLQETMQESIEDKKKLEKLMLINHTCENGYPPMASLEGS